MKLFVLFLRSTYRKGSAGSYGMVAIQTLNIGVIGNMET